MTEVEVLLETDLLLIEDRDKPLYIIKENFCIVYIEDEIAEKITKAKLHGFCKISYNIIKNLFKLELANHQVVDNLFNIKNCFYIPFSKNNTFYTYIIKEDYTFL